MRVMGVVVVWIARNKAKVVAEMKSLLCLLCVTVRVCEVCLVFFMHACKNAYVCVRACGVRAGERLEV